MRRKEANMGFKRKKRSQNAYIAFLFCLKSDLSENFIIGKTRWIT